MNHKDIVEGVITAMWKHIQYIKKGLSHETAGTDCQDSVQIHEDDRCIVAALADGLGSLKYSALASQTATAAACQWLSSTDQENLRLDTPDREAQFRAEFSGAVAAAVRNTASQKNLKLRSLDCTLAFVFLSKLHGFALAGIIGDSAICVISKSSSLVMTDSGGLANSTRAVQDRDAGAHMLLRRFDLDAEDILGFILTSDGLDNDIYIKGSPHVNQAAEDYFNALLEPNPVQVVDEIVSELVKYPDTPFDDDISVAVVSRAESKIQLESDPTWLCSCGCRNILQNTYCVECYQDFTKLYSSIRFREHGGKAAFFKKINQDPAAERKLVCPSSDSAPVSEPRAAAMESSPQDLQEAESTPPVPEKAASRPDPVPKKKQFPKSRLPEMNIRTVVALAAVAALAIGAIGGMLVGRLSARPKIDDLLKDVLAMRKELLEKDQQLEAALQQPVEENPTASLPSDFCVLEDGSYYWGPIVNAVPEGSGILLRDGTYYIGTFLEGLREGVFTVIPEGDSAQLETVTFSLGELQEEADQPVEPAAQILYTVLSDSQNVRNQPGTENSTVIGVVTKGHSFTATGNEQTIDETGWVEVLWKDGTAWVASSKLEKQPAE